jgi:5-methyltetrahydropteroyltriglutamate--homocysteine methyltransferase
MAAFGATSPGDDHPSCREDVDMTATPFTAPAHRRFTAPAHRRFTATILGSPRIGPHRELKRAVEKYWAGNLERTELESVAATLRRDTWEALAAAGLDSVPVNTFSYYDHVLDTAAMVGALPPRVTGDSVDLADDLDRYFAAARGNDEIAPLEMTKWFDTNYHYIVPEIGPDTRF